jgi:hypothetical protein
VVVEVLRSPPEIDHRHIVVPRHPHDGRIDDLSHTRLLQVGTTF